MNIREKNGASGISKEANVSIARRISAIFPSSITNWFSRKRSLSSSGLVNITEPDCKRKRPSEDSSHYIPSTECASTNTASIYSMQGSSFNTTLRVSQNRTREEDLGNTAEGDPTLSTPKAENRVSFILKSSLSSGDANKKQPSGILSSTPLKETTFHPGKSSFNINGTSNKSSKIMQSKSSSFCPHKTSLDISRTSGSTFYPGRTTYGGAANTSNTKSLKEPKRSKIGIKSLNGSEENIDLQMSGPSKRILSLLENYSSPLGEIRRISQFVKEERNFNSSPTIVDAKPKPISNKTRELHVPSIASILSIKKKSVLMATTSTANQLLASQSSTDPYPISSHKTRKSINQRIMKTMNETNEGAAPLELASNVLKISTELLPTFSFTPSLPASKHLPTTSKSINSNVLTESNTIGNSKKIEPKPTVFECTKSVSSIETQNGMNGSDAIFLNKNTATEKRIDNRDVCDIVQSDSTMKCNSSEKKMPPKVSDMPETQNSVWTCEDCWVKNDMSSSKCVCCGGKQPLKKSDTNKTLPVEPKESCALIEDNIRNEDKNTQSAHTNSGYYNINKKDSDKHPEENWECHVCLLKNDKHNGKCSCCEAVQPGYLKSTTISSNNSEELNNKKWECNVCLVKNDMDKTKCVCCEAEKPSNEKPASITLKKAEDIKSKGEKWECTICLVKNDMDKTKCVCCEAEKASNEKPASITIKNAEDIKNKDEKWECTVCLVKNEIDKNKCVCCESQKPGPKTSALKFNFTLPTNTSFKFGINPIIESNEKQNDTEVKESNLNVTGFSFGIPLSNSDGKSLDNVEKSKPSPAASTFIFGIPKEDKKSTFGEVTPEASSILKFEKTKEKEQETSIAINKPATSLLPEPDKMATTSDVLKSESKPSSSFTGPSTFSFQAPKEQVVPTSLEPTVTSANATVPLAFIPTQTPMFGKRDDKKQNNQVDSSSLFQKSPNLCFSLPVKSTNTLFGDKDMTDTSTPTLFQQNDASKVTAITTSTAAVTNTISSSFDKPLFTMPSQPPPSSMFIFGSNSTTNNTDSRSALHFSFGSNNLTSNNIVEFGAQPLGKFEPKTDLPNRLTSDINSAVTGTSGSNILSGNGLTNNSFDSKKPSNSLFMTDSAMPAGGIFGAETQKEKPFKNLFAAQETNLSTKQSSTPFNFGNYMPFGGNSHNNVPAFPNTTPGSSALGRPAPKLTKNNSSMFSNNTGVTGSFFGQPSTNSIGGFPVGGSAFPEPSNQPPAFNFSAGQNPGVFNFSQQPGVPGMSGVATPQFQVGSSSMQPQTRRIRKAVRRISQR